MRLLNSRALLDPHSQTLEVVEFFGDSIPKYAILSHTWSKIDKDEVSFQDISLPLEDVKKKAAFEKVRYCAQQALQDGYSWCWIDTCCIDKSSSAELTEAINSMYAWYKASEVCYAYLEDVKIDGRWTKDQREDWQRSFAASLWFTRSWTLQELIAPSHLRFYGQGWMSFGTREELLELISEITNIQRVVLVDAAPEKASIAQRMCWASKRSAKRIEDKAYSLMGLFDVHMPLLYGEGIRSFQRLQKKIIKSSDDETIFAWTNPGAGRHTYSGLLAQSPSHFEGTRDIIPRYEWKQISEPYSVTNKGLRIQFECYQNEGELEAFALLGCFKRHISTPLYIRVRRLLAQSEQWVRVDSHKLYTNSDLKNERRLTYRMFFRQNIQLHENHLSSRVRGFRLVSKSLQVTEVWPAYSDSTALGFVAIPCESRYFDARVLFRSTISATTPIIELEYNGTPQSIPSKVENDKVNPLSFTGTLSWVNHNYQDISKPPSSEDCSDIGDWRCHTLEMNLALVENDLFIDVTIPGVMDWGMTTFIHGKAEIHRNILVPQLSIPGPKTERSPHSRFQNPFSSTIRGKRSLSLPAAETFRMSKPTESPVDEAASAQSPSRNEYVNHDIRIVSAPLILH